ncbi:MAG: YgfZ/GcvT domain-containing protein [Planctomycetota bacterium]
MDRSILLDLHRSAGARVSSGDAPSLLTYGDVPGEYRAALEDCAVFDESDRGLLEIGGADSASFLHRILASDVKSLQSGGGQRSLLLSSKGKVLFDFDLFRGPESLWISAPPGCASNLATALENYHFAEKLEIAVVATHAPLAVCGPRAENLVRAVVGTPLPADEHAWIRGSFEDSAIVLSRVPVAGSTGIRLDAGPERASALWNALRAAGATPAGLVARDCLRVERGAALFGADIDSNVYPQEARLEAAFSLTKGCYVGQEVVAKIDTYGGLNKRLVALRISHDDPVPRGTRLLREDEGELRDLGVVTSWAYSFALNGGAALGYVKRRHQEPGTVFRLGETAAEAVIVEFPIFTSAGPLTGSSRRDP